MAILFFFFSKNGFNEEKKKKWSFNLSKGKVYSKDPQSVYCEWLKGLYSLKQNNYVFLTTEKDNCNADEDLTSTPSYRISHSKLGHGSACFKL